MQKSFCSDILSCLKPQYHPSKNPYYTLLIEASQRHPCQAFVDDQTELHKGNWRTFFDPAPAKLILEIGCNAGHCLIPTAQGNPKNAYLGLDYKYKAIGRAWLKAQKQGITNVAFLRANAHRLSNVFAAQEVDEILIYFPDPWIRRSQAKHQWLTPQMISIFHEILRPQGRVCFKSDHLKTFEAILSYFTSLNWEIISSTTDLHQNNPLAKKLNLPDVTVFERLFIKEGIPIKHFIAQKK